MAPRFQFNSAPRRRSSTLESRTPTGSLATHMGTAPFVRGWTIASVLIVLVWLGRLALGN